MATGIQISPPSGITIGTTAISSGTDTRVFFQQGGVVQQDANFTFNNTQKRLTLRAVGTAATDIPFAVQNSAGTQNLLRVSGTAITLNGPSGTAFTPCIDLQRNGSSIFFIDEYAAKFNGPAYFSSIVGYNTNAISVSSQSGPAGQAITLYPASSGLSLGYSSTAARLDVRSQGALSTDIAFRVRNSGDTANIFEIQGDSVVTSRTRMNCGFQGMTTTGGALHVYAGNNNDFVSRWYNTGGTEIMSLRTNGNGGVLSLNDASGAAGVTINGIFSNALTFGAGRNIWFDTATGTKIGAATNQRFAFWNKTPIVQPTTAIAAAAFVANTSGILNDTATFDGYTIGQVVKALRDVGLLA